MLKTFVKHEEHYFHVTKVEILEGLFLQEFGSDTTIIWLI